ncbi:MAG: formylglycine-generating enzyme family protein [Polyangiaceae bacterium]|nr:formylglycine-generating enzyme family protein [Polyangiaceae bacterium]
MGAPYSVKPESDYYLHTVALKSFCLDLTEVTVANYKECVENKSCTKPHSNGFSCTFDIPTKLNHPINCVDYQQAKQACETFGKRLPSEEEWEYAARGGQEGRTYSWGESEPSRTLSCYDHPGTCAVDAHPPGAYGLLGMTGNVWEWTSSPYVKYAGWNPVGEWRVYRGGSYSRRFPKWMKTWVRNRFRPGEWGAHLGFRCASDVESNCPTGTSPQENNPTRCLFPGEKLPKTSQTTSQGTWNDNSPPPVVTRSPHFDQDCLRHKPATPVAYELKGSSFAQRQKLKANLGCANRDVGSDFNSVCCPQ